MANAFVMKRTVQFAETDLAGVLHFANYYRFMEEAEHAMWRSQGESVIGCDGDQEISWPRVSTACEYFAPAHFEDELWLTVTVVKVGDRSVTYEIEFCKGDTRVALGKTTAVCCSMRDGVFQSISIPAKLRTMLEEQAKSGTSST